MVVETLALTVRCGVGGILHSDVQSYLMVLRTLVLGAILILDLGNLRHLRLFAWGGETVFNGWLLQLDGFVGATRTDLINLLVLGSLLCLQMLQILLIVFVLLPKLNVSKQLLISFIQVVLTLEDVASIVVLFVCEWDHSLVHTHDEGVVFWFLIGETVEN